MSLILKNETIEFLKQNPLLLETFSEEAIDPEIYENASEKVVFFGTGLTTRSAPSQGLPLDFVAYLTSAEQLRRHFGFKKIVHIIADIHALSNSFMDEDYTTRLADQIKGQAQQAAKNLGLEDLYEVRLASEFHETPEFQEVLQDAEAKVSALGLPDDAFSYVHSQIADMEYFVRHLNAGLKLSWILDPKKARESKGFDERAFDRAYREIYGSGRLSAAYTVSGYTAEPSKFRASPYTFAPGEKRVLLDSEYDIASFIEDLSEVVQNGSNGERRAAQNVTDHMAMTVEQFEETFGVLEGRTLAEKISVLTTDRFLDKDRNKAVLLTQSFEVASPSSIDLTIDPSALEKLEDRAEIIEPKQGLDKKLKKGKPLIVKLGFDPTAPDLHLGHAVVLKKMREFQEEGHKIVIIIGDYTARIGDPTGRNATRPELSEAEIKDNARTYINQLSKILDVEKIKVRFNSEWFDRKNFADVLKLMAQTTLAQLLERRDFSERYSQGLPIHMHEMAYPLMQGTDSVEIRADIEMGGTDQLFNNLMGRHLQERFGQEGQVVVCMPILPGLDGVEKMSKSKNNYVGLTDEPTEMFGKIMSIPDSVLPEYLDLTTDFGPIVRDLIKSGLDKGGNPMKAKMMVAENVVKQYHGGEAAKLAVEYFDRNVRKRENTERDFDQVDFDDVANEKTSISVIEICKRIRPNESNKQIKRLIQGGALRINGQKVEDEFLEISSSGEDVMIQFGKRGLLKLIRSNDNQESQSTLVVKPKPPSL